MNETETPALTRLARLLGLPLAAFRALNPHGPDSPMNSFPAALVGPQDERTWLERIEDEERAAGWRRAR